MSLIASSQGRTPLPRLTSSIEFFKRKRAGGGRTLKRECCCFKRQSSSSSFAQRSPSSPSPAHTGIAMEGSPQPRARAGGFGTAGMRACVCGPLHTVFFTSTFLFWGEVEVEEKIFFLCDRFCSSPFPSRGISLRTPRHSSSPSPSLPPSLSLTHTYSHTQGRHARALNATVSRGEWQAWH